MSRYPANIEKKVASAFNCFSRGILDSISVHKTLPLLVNRPNLAVTVGQILAANLGLLLGAIALFDKVITPGLKHLRREIVVAEAGILTESETDVFIKIIWIIFYTFFIVPIFILCYGCSSSWYQAVADDMHKREKGLSKEAPVVKSLADGAYSSVSWFVLFGQLEILSTIAPMLIDWMISLVNSYSKSGDTTDAASSAFQISISALLLALIAAALRHLKSLCYFASLVLMSALYGWYVLSQNSKFD
jgi:hypothetical protein